MKTFEAPDFTEDLDAEALLLYALVQDEDPEEVIKMRVDLYSDFMAGGWRQLQETGFFDEKEFEKHRQGIIEAANTYFLSSFDAAAGGEVELKMMEAAYNIYEARLDAFERYID